MHITCVHLSQARTPRVRLRQWDLGSVFLEDFIYLYIMFVHQDLDVNLLFEHQGHGVGRRLLVLLPGPQVGFLVAPALPQPVTLFVKFEAWHEDEVQAVF